MLKCYKITIFLSVLLVLLEIASSTPKFKICVVDGKGDSQKTDKHCPKLQTEDSLIECVKAFDRFDCLRKIRKGFADFSIFTPEDLIAAMNTDNDILITNELRYWEKDPYEEEIVAVIPADSGITSSYDLRDKILCHPGYGSEGFVSEVLANFLESTIVRTQSCQPSLTVPENRIAASSKFFKSACKPGPWVNDLDVSHQLKVKYPNLCQACDGRYSCSTNDKYYGSRGALYCLTDGAGDIAWTTYKQVQAQFKLNGNPTSDASQYKFLCRDDPVRPLNASNPCTWVAKPWSVIAANSKTASTVQGILRNITHTEDWRGAVLDLLEVVAYHVTVFTLDNVEAVESYLHKIPGFLDANSFTPCHPSRTIKICTTSIPAQYKCGWMREAAAVMGIEPDIDCLKADNETHCMEAIQRSVADVVIVHPDYVNVAKSKYDLKPLFYETVNDKHKYLTVAVVKRESKVTSLEDLRGKKACFPLYDGVAWNTMVSQLTDKNIITGCPFEKAMEDFFGKSCVPDVPSEFGNLNQLCKNNEYRGDLGALKCLKENIGDVAFVSQNTLREFTMEKDNFKFDFRVMNEDTHSFLSWAPPGQAMVSKNITSWRDKDILDVFLELDNLFGVNSKESTKMFTMFGEFDGRANILFNDNTMQLRKTPKYKDYDDMPKLYEDLLEKSKTCRQSNSSRTVPSMLMIFVITLSYFKIL